MELVSGSTNQNTGPGGGEVKNRIGPKKQLMCVHHMAPRSY